MKRKKLFLTDRELEVLKHHWSSNINFGVDGSFGDGENFVSYNEESGEPYNSKNDLNIAKIILLKLKKI